MRQHGLFSKRASWVYADYIRAQKRKSANELWPEPRGPWQNTLQTWFCRCLSCPKELEVRHAFSFSCCGKMRQALWLTSVVWFLKESAALASYPDINRSYKINKARPPVHR